VEVASSAIFYAISIFDTTWRTHLSQIGRIIAMSKFFCLGYVVRVQEEI